MEPLSLPYIGTDNSRVVWTLALYSPSGLGCPCGPLSSFRDHISAATSGIRQQPITVTSQARAVRDIPEHLFENTAVAAAQLPCTGHFGEVPHLMNYGAGENASPRPKTQNVENP